MDTLTVDQTIALFNIIGYYMLLQTSFSIIAGDSLVEKFKLETRFPKLSKFIKIRAKLRRASLWMNVIIFLVLL